MVGIFRFMTYLDVMDNWPSSVCQSILAGPFRKYLAIQKKNARRLF